MEAQAQTIDRQGRILWVVASLLVGAFVVVAAFKGPGQVANAKQVYESECTAEQKQVCLKLGFPDGSPQQAGCMKEIATVQTNEGKRVAARDKSFL